MPIVNVMATRLIRLRYAGSCARCRAALAVGERAWWDASDKTVVCDECGTHDAAMIVESTPGESARAAALDVGVAGGSARAEYERRNQRREAAVRARHPHLGNLILNAMAEPQTITAWKQGAEGEVRVGARLDELVSGGMVILHDRRVPGSRANIDHVVVAPSGVWIVDSKRYSGRVDRRDVGGWLRRDVRLYLGRRDCTRLVGGMAKQVAAVQRSTEGTRPPTWPVLCFTGAEWSLFAKPFELGGVLVIWPRALVRAITRAPDRGVLVSEVAARIAHQLPPQTAGSAET
jgi:hypothetical protein